MNRQPVVITRESFASYGRSRGRKKRSKEYDLTPSKDGIPRMTVSVDFRLNFHDLADAVACGIEGEALISGWVNAYNFSEDDNDTLDGGIDRRVRAVVRTKRQAIDFARDTLQEYGNENYHYKVGDDKGLSKVSDALKVHLEQLWKE